MIKVRTWGQKYSHVLSTGFKIKVPTWGKKYSHIAVCFSMYQVHTFLSFLRSTSVYILNQSDSDLCTWVSDSIAHMPGPACLLASSSGIGPSIEPNHTKAVAGLFTAAWHHPCQCLGTWVWALAAFWGSQLLLVSITRLAITISSCLLTSSTCPSQQRCASCKRACEELGLQVVASMMSCKVFKRFGQVQRADLAWSWAVQMVTGTLTLSSVTRVKLRKLLQNIQTILPCSEAG
jgi:hypothetical protein